MKEAFWKWIYPWIKVLVCLVYYSCKWIKASINLTHTGTWWILFYSSRCMNCTPMQILRNISMIVPRILWMIKALNQTSYSKEYFCIDYETVVYANVKFRLSCTMT